MAFTAGGMDAQACATASAAHVKAVFKESMRLNEAFKSTAFDSKAGSPYQLLRKKMELYSEDVAQGCSERAVILLRQKSDPSLVRALFAYSLSEENSADETLSFVSIQVFIQNGADFAEVWGASDAPTKEAVVSRVRSGWVYTKRDYPLPKQQEVESRLKHLEIK